MVRTIKKINIVALMSVMSLSVLFTAVSFNGSAYAIEGTETEAEKTTEVERSTEDRTHAKKELLERLQAKEKAAEERRVAAKEKLSEAKLKACNNRKTNITNRVEKISERATHHLTVFSKISERAQAFYTAKGNELANYDALVAEVDAKRASAETAVNDLQAQKDSFTCEGVDPKSAIATYKTALETTRTALKDYRTAIKNLIVGIKTVNATDDTTTTKPSGEAQ